MNGAKMQEGCKKAQRAVVGISGSKGREYVQRASVGASQHKG